MNEFADRKDFLVCNKNLLKPSEKKNCFYGVKLHLVSCCAESGLLVLVSFLLLKSKEKYLITLLQTAFGIEIGIVSKT